MIFGIVMFKCIFFLAFASALQLVAAELTIDNLIQILDKTSTFMPDDYDKNSSYALAVAGSELLLINTIDKSKWEEFDSDIAGVLDDVMQTLNSNLRDITTGNYEQDATYANVFFVPQHWHYEYSGSFEFKSGQVSGKASTDSSSKLLAEGTKTDEQCFKKLYENGQSNEKRSCGISEDCLKKATNTKKDGDMSAEHRIQFLNDMAVLNCTERPKEMPEIITKLCTILYPQVLKINQEPIAIGTASLYMKKVLWCGTFGFPEFYADDIVQRIIDLINDDGTVGKNPDNKAEIRKLTAQTITLLSSTVRMKIQTS